MAEYGLTEAEAWTIITQGVNFGMTQLVDGNWGVHALVPKAIFESADELQVNCGEGGDTSSGNWVGIHHLLIIGAILLSSIVAL